MDSDTQPLTSETSVEVMIAACLRGDQVGFSGLYDRFASGVYRLCYSLLFNKQDAEDVVQEAFVYAFKNLHRFDPSRASFKTWLYTIAVSRCRNMYRRKLLPSLDVLQIFNLNIAAPRAQTPEAEYLRRDATEAVESALASLTPRLREAVVLRYGHGLTYREIAAVLGCPQKTAESRVRLAHGRLRGIMQSFGPGLLEELLSI